MDNGIKTFQMRTRLIYGSGSSELIGAEADLLSREKKVLVVTDEGIRKSGILNTITTQLEKSALSYAIFDQVPEDPDVEVVEACLKKSQTHGADVLIGFGGGSPMCAAKATAMLATNGGSLIDYEGVHKAHTEAMPLIAIPTTAGSGTEVSPVFIIKNRKTHCKMAFLSEYHYPRIAILDPSFLDTLPPKKAIYSSADALSHAVEAYWSVDATPLTDALALKAISSIYENMGPAAFSCSRSRQLEMLLASAMANIACGNARLGLVHVMADDLKLPHGLACGICLPHVMEYNLPACEERIADIALALGKGRSARNALEAIMDLWAKVGIPFRLNEKPHKSVDQVVERVMSEPLLKYNPRIPEPADIEGLWKGLFVGEG
jgi:alcohol dehydrogenase class IV